MTIEFGVKMEEILGAVARGWCANGNTNKEMDTMLASAIADEVFKITETLAERERMRLAAIGVATIGYWKEGDSINSEYDTVTLRDVARLYQRNTNTEGAARG